MDCVPVSKIMIFVLMLMLIIVQGQEAEQVITGSDEYCMWDTFNATCPSTAVILITKAKYGRMRMGRCMSRDYSIGCYSDVTRELDQRCSGRRACTVVVPDPQLHDIQPCPPDLSYYLEAAYTCIEVQNNFKDTCHSYRPISVESTTGYLSSLVTIETGYGSSRCPWKLKAAPGQRVNITLLDFGTSKNIQRKDMTFCPVYAKIKEAGEMREATVCGDAVREKRVYTSVSSEVDLSMEIAAALDSDQHFVFKYEAVGCATPTPPVGGWLQREGETLVIGCNKTTKKWHLVCQNTHWVGHYDNCTAGQSWSVLGQVFPNEGDFPYGLVVSVVIGVVLGVVVGVSLLGVVLVCRKRNQRRAMNGALMYQSPYGGPTNQESGYGDGSSKKWVPGAHGVPYSSYAHIWEIKQAAGQNSQYHPAQYPVDTRGQPVSPRDGVLPIPVPAVQRCQSRAKEHIYESPKFDRKDSADSYTDPPFYHEFDGDSPPHDLQGQCHLQGQGHLPGQGHLQGQDKNGNTSQNMNIGRGRRYEMDESRYSS